MIREAKRLTEALQDPEYVKKKVEQAADKWAQTTKAIKEKAKEQKQETLIEDLTEQVRKEHIKQKLKAQYRITNTREEALYTPLFKQAQAELRTVRNKLFNRVLVNGEYVYKCKIHNLPENLCAECNPVVKYLEQKNEYEQQELQIMHREQLTAKEVLEKKVEQIAETNLFLETSPAETDEPTVYLGNKNSIIQTGQRRIQQTNRESDFIPGGKKQEDPASYLKKFMYCNLCILAGRGTYKLLRPTNEPDFSSCPCVHTHTDEEYQQYLKRIGYTEQVITTKHNTGVRQDG